MDYYCHESMYFRPIVGHGQATWEEWNKGMIAYIGALSCSLTRANNVASCEILMGKMHSKPQAHGYLTIIRLLKHLLFSANTAALPSQ